MAKRETGRCSTRNPHVLGWVRHVAELCEPAEIFWCDGTEAEKEFLTAQAVARGVLTKLAPHKLPGCYYHRSDPNDVARVEERTFICTETRDEAGPTNNWAPPAETYEKLHGLLRGSMRGRTLYVVPYLMGHLGSPMAKVGIEVTDSIY